MRVLFGVLFWGFFFFPIQAQVSKYGEVPRDHLEMAVYDQDSSAGAVVLFETGNSELNFINNLFQLSTEYHTRIKILNDESLDLANVTIRHRHNEPEQKVRNIKASSYCLDAAGNMQESRLERKDIFTNEVSDYRSETKFSIPNVQSGCVIEYIYDQSSEYPLDFPDWFYQWEVPVMWSEYRTKIPEFFKYLSVTRGYQEYHVQESEEYTERITIRPTAGPRVRAGERNTGRSAQPIRDFEFQGEQSRYVMKDIPAIKNEPFMRAKIDYLAHIRFQLAGIDMPGELPQRSIETWEEVVEGLDEYRNYGDRLKSSRTLSDAAKTATDGISNNLDKMIAIYNHIQDNIEWDNSYRLYMDKALDEYYNGGIAHSTAMNFILVQMLREVGFEAHPVLVSTAANGEIIGLFPEERQFNSTITYVAVDGNYYLLDPKNSARPYNILPFNILGTQGLMMYPDQLIWLPIDQIVKNSSFKNVNISIADDSIRGEISTQLKGLYAVDMDELHSGDDFKQALSDDYFGRETRFELANLTVNSAEVLDGYDFKFEITSDGIGEYSTFYFNPMIMDRLSANPFKLENRTYPVDYNYPFDENIVMTITFPENWQVDELPKPVLYRLPGRAGEFRRIIRADGNTISLNYRFKIDKMRFMPEEYEVLKGMYDQMVESLNENIVFTKL